MITATPEYLELLANALSIDKKITIAQSSTGNWYSDIEKNIIYYNRPDLQLYSLTIIRGLILHEVAHILYTTEEKEDETRASIQKYGYKLVHDLDNMFEDVRIETKLNAEYKDFTTSPLALMAARFLSTFLEDAKKNNYDFTRMSRYQQALCLVFMYKFFWLNPYADHVYNDIQSALKGEWDVKVRAKVATHCISEIKDIVYESRVVPTTLCIKSLVDDKFLPLVEEFIEDQDTSTPVPILKHRHCDLEVSSRSRASERTLEDRSHSTEWTKLTKKEARALLAPYINTLSVRLLAILKEQQATRWTGQYRAGKLLNRNVYKVATREERIFTKRVTPNVPKHNVYLGLDRSGSMGKDRIISSYLAGVLVEAVCEKLGFPVELYTYHTSIKHIKNIEQYDGGGYDNCEDKLFNRVATDIKASGREHDDNFLFVITDGGTDRDEKFIKGETALHKVSTTLFGVGIGDTSVESMIRRVYKNGIYVKEVQELPFAMINFMRTIIHR